MCVCLCMCSVCTCSVCMCVCMCVIGMNYNVQHFSLYVTPTQLIRSTYDGIMCILVYKAAL